MGYRTPPGPANGTAVGQEPESMYMVTSGRHYNNHCCVGLGPHPQDLGQESFPDPSIFLVQKAGCITISIYSCTIFTEFCNSVYMHVTPCSAFVFSIQKPFSDPAFWSPGFDYGE